MNATQQLSSAVQPSVNLVVRVKTKYLQNGGGFFFFFVDRTKSNSTCVVNSTIRQERKRLSIGYSVCVRERDGRLRIRCRNNHRSHRAKNNEAELRTSTGQLVPNTEVRCPVRLGLSSQEVKTMMASVSLGGAAFNRR